jgi:hypothetical protein
MHCFDSNNDGIITTSDIYNLISQGKSEEEDAKYILKNYKNGIIIMEIN